MRLTLEVDVGQEISIGENVTIRLQHKSGRKARLVFVSTGTTPVPIQLRDTPQEKDSWIVRQEKKKH